MPIPDPNIRLSNADREALVARLHAATEEGRLDLEEFAERSTRVYEAKTFADVERLLADLPEDDRALAVPKRPRAAANTPDLVLNPVHSQVKREGAWTVPARITTKQKHSGIKLDCREAVFTGDDVALDVDLTHSRLTLVLPRHASAVDDGVELLGGAVVNKCSRVTDGPTVHLTGTSRYGRVVVRYERRFLWWRY
ncbi:protein of unknown function [Glycomyces sambucus]|uniref:DUF1707 domain-containing protein n=1 Tax=Glycomyces sambucus TaxID=380244 RepID=A0A1G9LNQ6_9ACTN|nr:DUF1707 domain-containing protein [Glycomyces sambucus]SDL63560.1 protein of unknown function [Glycomyces sambucus]